MFDPLAFVCYLLGAGTSLAVDFFKRLPIVARFPALTATVVGFAWPLILHAMGQHDTPLTLGWVLYCGFGSAASSVFTRERITKPVRRYFTGK